MSKPLNNFVWATLTNYASGPNVGTPTKVAPPSGERASGFVAQTAAVPQEINYLFGEVQSWLAYVAGLATDSEFLGDLMTQPFTFTAATTTVGHALVVSGSTTVVALTASGALVANGTLTANSTFHAVGAATLDSTALISGALTLGSTLTMPSRTATKRIPLDFSPGYYNNSGILQPQGYHGGGTGGRGFHFFGSVGGGNIFFPVLEFTVPNGATLVNINVCGRRCAAATTNVIMELKRLDGGGASNTESALLVTDTFSSSTGTTKNLLIATGDRVVSDSFTSYQLEIKPSEGSTAGDPDLISWINISYTTTHADENT